MLWLGIVIGLPLGVAFGVVVLGLCVASGSSS